MSPLDASPLNDNQLITLAQQGDQSAFTELMKRYRKAVYHLILKIVKSDEEAEDLTLIAFSKAFLNISSYTPTYSFATWLFSIASNASIDWLRKKRLPVVGFDHIHTPGESEPVIYQYPTTYSADAPDNEIMKQQREEAVKHLLHRLPPDLERIVILRFLREMSYEEISKELDMPLGTVKVKLHRARKALLEILKNAPPPW